MYNVHSMQIWPRDKVGASANGQWLFFWHDYQFNRVSELHIHGATSDEMKAIADAINAAIENSKRRSAEERAAAEYVEAAE